MTEKYLDEISNFIFSSKYARYNENIKRRETWEEAINRVEGMHLSRYSFLNENDKKKIKWAFDLVRDKRIVPSMRSIQYGGKAIEAHEARIFNCAVRHVDSLRSFAEIFYLLLCGNGVGIGISKHFLNRLPNLVNAKDKTGSIMTYTVEDSIEGWSDSIEALLNCYFRNTPYTGRKIVFDYSKIRPKGSLLKTGGGKAPGYKGLKSSHIKIKSLLDHVIEFRHQNQLRSLDAYDILMHCADAVLSGGCRRSATAVIFDKDDTDMLNAKTYHKVDKIYKFSESRKEVVGGKETVYFEGKIVYEGIKYEIEVEGWDLERLEKNLEVSWRHLFPQRARSNNSVLLMRDQITHDEFAKIVERTKQFGEPGFVFGNDSKQLFNPCVTGDTEILTQDGYVNIESVVDTELKIWNGFEWSNVIPKVTGHNQPILKIKTSDGRELKCTHYHNWVIASDYWSGIVRKKAIDLKIGDKLIKNQFPVISTGEVGENSYTQGFISGDGMDGYNLFWLYEPKFGCLSRFAGTHTNETCFENVNKTKRMVVYLDFTPLPKDFVPFKWNLESKLQWLAGLFDADGTELKEGGLQIVSINFTFLKDLQKLLSLCGIQSKIVHASFAGYRDLPDGKGGHKPYFCQDAQRICIGAVGIQNLVNLGMKCERLKFNKFPNRDASQYVKITSIEDVGFADTVYCFNEPKRHLGIFNGIITGQCYEIGFIPVTEDGVCGVQFCNLTSINGRLTDTEEKFKESVEAYTIIGTLQAGYTSFPYLSKAAEELTRDEALLGCSITGMMDNPHVLLNPALQKKMAKFAVQTNKEWAEKIGIKQAARITCVKPEGTSSLVLGTGSGIHPHHARKYFRRVQNNKLDNVYKYFKKHNPDLCEPSVWSANNTDDVITFPIEVKKDAIIKSDLTAIQHLEYIKSTQQNWVLTGTTDANKKPIEHNVSCTVIVNEGEWESVIDYLFKNRQFFAAVSLLSSYGDKLYPQAPMEAVMREDEERWEKVISNFNTVNYIELRENEDKTSLQQEGACYGGQCEIKL